jgi:hypothetical protein
MNRDINASGASLNRRDLLHSGVRGCLTCAAISLGLLRETRAAAAMEIDGKGYALRFVGSQREAMMMGKRQATLDLRTLKGRPHLYRSARVAGRRSDHRGRPAVDRTDRRRSAYPGGTAHLDRWGLKSGAVLMLPER